MATSCTVSITSGGLKQITGPLPPAPAAVSTRHDAGETLLAAERGLSWTPPPTRHLMRLNIRAAPAAPIRASLPRSQRTERPRLPALSLFNPRVWKLPESPSLPPKP